MGLDGITGKVADTVNDKTDNKYADKVQQARDLAGSHLGDKRSELSAHHPDYP